MSQTRIISSMSACMNVPEMSRMATPLYSLAFITQDRNMDSVAMMGEIVSSFLLYTICFLPYVHPRPLIIPQRFYFSNIIYSSAFFLYSLVSMFGLSVYSTSHMCSCFI